MNLRKGFFKNKNFFIDETFNYKPILNVLTFSQFWNIDWNTHLICFVLGFPLAILFFINQMIVTKTVDNQQNKY